MYPGSLGGHLVDPEVFSPCQRVSEGHRNQASQKDTRPTPQSIALNKTRTWVLRCNFLTKINTMNRDRDKTKIMMHNTKIAQSHNVGTLPPTSPISPPFHVPSSSGCTLPLWTSASPNPGLVTTTTTLPHTHTHTLSLLTRLLSCPGSPLA